jgi:hypothetical protein
VCWRIQKQFEYWSNSFYDNQASWKAGVPRRLQLTNIQSKSSAAGLISNQSNWKKN